MCRYSYKNLYSKLPNCEVQPRSQGLSSSRPRDVKRRDPGNEVVRSYGGYEGGGGGVEGGIHPTGLRSKKKRPSLYHVKGGLHLNASFPPLNKALFINGNI